MINIYEVVETNNMIEKENLDVRTITLGISLLDCIDSDLKVLNEKIYKKIYEASKDLVKTGEEISREFGIPIVNKRISVTPIALVGGAACKTKEDFASIAKTLDKVAKEVGVNFIGGYSALVSKGMTAADELLIRSIPLALSTTERVCSSVNLGSTKTGINMDAVKLMGEMVKETAEFTREQDSLGCAKLVVFCNAPDDNPFMAGAFHGVTEADKIINVGVSGPGVVKTALEKVRGENFEVLCETIKKTAFKVTRVGQLVAQEASKATISFYVAECMEHPTYGEFHETADLKEAFEILDTIPPQRLNAVTGIGFVLHDENSAVNGAQYPLMQFDQVQADAINYVAEFKESPLVQDAMKECEQILKDRKKVMESVVEKPHGDMSSDRDASSNKKSVLKTLKEKQEIVDKAKAAPAPAKAKEAVR